VSIELLTTKVHIPSAAADLVPRPLLTKRLNDGVRRKLTLISAPAGFGKTSLLGQWLTTPPGSEWPAAWVSLEEDDNDPARFFTYLIAALQTINPGVGETSLALLYSPQPPPIESVVTTLINEITLIPDDFCLILDDYHLIEAQSIHSALTILLDHLPEHMHLVISSRTDPPLPLARMRGRGELAELRTSDLQFTIEEAATFFNQFMGMDLSTGEVARLESRTEGWIAGLQLAALSMQGREDLAGFIEAFSGTHRYLLDYLGEEVLQRQPETVQSFLVQTSILGRLSGPLCDAVTGQADGQAMLEKLERANLFTVPLDDERRWYRYHHLFADFLSRHLSQRETSRVSNLHRRACTWYEGNGLSVEAVGHALAAADFDTAARLIEQTAEATGMWGEVTTLLGWLDSLPYELVRARPKLCVYHAWALLSTVQPDGAARRLQEAEGALTDMSNGSSETQGILGQVAVLRAILARFLVDIPDIPRSVELSQEALERLPQDSLLWRGYAVLNLGTAHIMNGDAAAAAAAYREARSLGEKAGDIHMVLVATLGRANAEWSQGKLRQAHKTIQQALHLAAERGAEKIPVVGHLHAQMGRLLCEWNDLDAATLHLNSSIELGREYWSDEVLVNAYLNLAQVKQAQGDLDAALDFVDQVIQIAERLNLPQFVANDLAPLQARLWMAQGNLEASALWAEGSGLSASDDPSLLRLSEYSTLARVLIAQGKLDNAMRLLERLLLMAEGAGWMADVVECLILQALTLQAQGAVSQAVGTLERALVIAEPEGYVRTFVEEGELVAALLSKVLQAQEQGSRLESRKISRAYGRKLVAAFRELAADDVSPTLESPRLQLVVPLSERELEVLQLIAAGMSNRKIAEELIVSVGTVKAHAHNIYGKLDVESRAQAIARARDLNLLE